MHCISNHLNLLSPPFQAEEASKKDRSTKEKRGSQAQVDSKDVKTVAQKSESERQMADGGKTTETKSEMVDSQKSSSTTNNKTVDETTTTTKSIVIKADVHSGSIAQEESVTTAADPAPAESANATEPPAPSADVRGTKVETKEVAQSKSQVGQVASDEKKSATDEKVSIETTTVQEQAATSTQSNAATTAAPPTPSPQPPPTASSSPNKTDASQEKPDDAKPAEAAAQSAPKDENAKKLTIESIAATKLAASAVAAASKPSQDTAAAAASTGDGGQPKQSDAAAKSEADKKAEDTMASKDQAESQSQATGNAESSSAAAPPTATDSGAAPADAKPDEKNPNVDASESFHVLPKDKQQQQQTSDNLNQEKDDTGNLVPPNPPTGEPIRKTSFTVLKSDESIDDVLAGMNGNADDDGQVDGGSHAKSFKVLKAHGASGEDIILQQSSDQETGGNDNYEDYMTRNLAAYSGKYSDSELISGQLNGRRKKYKKRAKSVKQLTIVDGLSKDQDSGFEPSPRTVRASSQRAATTRAIYTANLPERPRVGDIIDCRSASTRFESGRKPGDKNAVNMSTVQATLQRNIRRYRLYIYSTRKIDGE